MRLADVADCVTHACCSAPTVFPFIHLPAGASCRRRPRPTWTGARCTPRRRPRAWPPRARPRERNVKGRSPRCFQAVAAQAGERFFKLHHPPVPAAEVTPCVCSWLSASQQQRACDVAPGVCCPHGASHGGAGVRVQQHRRGAAGCALHVRPLQRARQLQSQVFRDGAAGLLRLLTADKATVACPLLHGSGLCESPGLQLGTAARKGALWSRRSSCRTQRCWLRQHCRRCAARYRRRAIRSGSWLTSLLQLQQQLLAKDQPLALAVRLSMQSPRAIDC